MVLLCVNTTLFFFVLTFVLKNVHNYGVSAKNNNDVKIDFQAKTKNKNIRHGTLGGYLLGMFVKKKRNEMSYGLFVDTCLVNDVIKTNVITFSVRLEKQVLEGGA